MVTFFHPQDYSYKIVYRSGPREAVKEKFFSIQELLSSQQSGKGNFIHGLCLSPEFKFIWTWEEDTSLRIGF